MQLSAIDIGDGPPAVLLHGQPGTAGDWHAVAPLLADRMRVIAPDRPGYGRTGGSARGFQGNARALVALLDDLQVGSAVVAGHSWSTVVALVAALRFPDRVRALVLVAPIAPDLPPGQLDRALAHPVLGPIAARAGFRLTGAALALRPARRVARLAVPDVSTAQVAATAAQWRSDGVWRSFYTEQRALVTELSGLADPLRSLPKRAMIVYGTRDRISSPEHAIRLARLLPNAELVQADRAGHMLPQQRPELVAEAILSSASCR